MVLWITNPLFVFKLVTHLNVSVSDGAKLFLQLLLNQ